MTDIKYSAFIHSPEQLKCAIKYDIYKLYIPFDLFYNKTLSDKHITQIHENTKMMVYIALPEIIRLKDESYLNFLKDFLLLGKADGILIRNLEEIGFIYSLSGDLESQYISINGKIQEYTPLMIESDYTLYNWNQSSLKFNLQYCNKTTAPLELSIHEIKELDNRDLIVSIYGKAPLMISSNCVKKTCDECAHGKTYSFDRRLHDRKNKEQLVLINCIHCFNKLYNIIPTSLHKQMYELIKAGFYDFRLDFTNENANETSAILSYYLNDKRAGNFPVTEYTSGHILKGAM